MTNLPRIIHLATTDADFCTALLIDPEATLAEQCLEASADELAALVELRSLIAIPPQKLSALLATISDWDWGKVAVVPVPSA
jgi:hypothetical protein